MRFKKVYIEISNACNFNCSFCFQSKRQKRFMNSNEFEYIVKQLKPYTNYLYLHVLGEPLLHPDLLRILEIAKENDFFVNITTNGALVEKNKEILKKYPPRQINISLHDAEENIDKTKWDDYFSGILNFTKEIYSSTYVCFRLWNLKEGEKPSDFNLYCLEKIKHFFNITHIPIKTSGNGIKLMEHVFLQTENRFFWPDIDKKEGLVIQKSCLALKDHIAILSDGSVVPCCIDADANMLLGNIFESRIEDVVNSEKSVRILKGFERKIAVEQFCQTCGFR